MGWTLSPGLPCCKHTPSLPLSKGLPAALLNFLNTLDCSPWHLALLSLESELASSQYDFGHSLVGTPLQVLGQFQLCWWEETLEIYELKILMYTLLLTASTMLDRTYLT